MFALIITQKFDVFNSKYLEIFAITKKKQNIKITLRACRSKRRVLPTTRENSVQSPIRETLYILALLCHYHTEIASS